MAFSTVFSHTVGLIGRPGVMTMRVYLMRVYLIVTSYLMRVYLIVTSYETEMKQIRGTSSA